VWFFGTTPETHGVQLMLTVAAAFPIVWSVRTSRTLLRWACAIAAGVLLLAAHPLHAVLLPFVVLYILWGWSAPGELRLDRATLGRGLALGVCFVALAAVRVVDTGSNVPWSAGTLMGWAADSSAYQRLTGLWRYLALPYALFALVAMPFLACAVRGGHLRWSARGWGMRALLLIALWVPLVATVAYLGIFELGGYFVGLPVLLLTCLGAPALRVCARIEARVARRCPQLGGALPSARGSGGTGSARLPRGSTRMVGPGHCAGP